MAPWKPIVGRGFTAASFADYVDKLDFSEWEPEFVVVHNTSAPTLAQWHGKTPPEQRIQNLVGYYRDQQHWSAGPHLFVADDLIWVFTPLTTPGVHSPSWNSRSIGMEIVGEYEREDFAPVRPNVIAALAALHRKLGLDPGTIRFHKEDPRTTHKTCPGRNVNKDDLIAGVRAALGNASVAAADMPPDADAPGIEDGEHIEPLPAKLWRLARSKTAGSAGGISVASIIAVLTDWRVLAVICTFAIVCGAAYIVYERSKKA